jgi:uncharacterized protein DUF2683
LKYDNTYRKNKRANQKSKAFLEFAKNFLKEGKDVTIIEEEKSPYSPAFVKMVKDAAKRGKYTRIDPNDVWGSLGLK